MSQDWFAQWIEAERGRFFLLLPLVMGAAIPIYFLLPSEPPLWLGGAFLGLSAAGLASLVKCYALLFAPDPPAYLGGWDQRRDYHFANIAAVGAALTPLKLIRAAHHSPFENAIQALRGHISDTLLKTLPISTGSIAVTLLTGDEQIIPPEERQNFILSGLAHILAVAGLHVGIVMGLVFFASRWLLSRSLTVALHWPCKPIAAILSLGGGAGYTLLTGAHLPILRSLAMASLLTLGILMGRKAVSMRGLAIAAMALMLAMPEAILSASFQMSFSAVAALIAGYAALHPIWGFQASRGPLQTVLRHVAEHPCLSRPTSFSKLNLTGFPPISSLYL